MTKSLLVLSGDGLANENSQGISLLSVALTHEAIFAAEISFNGRSDKSWISGGNSDSTERVEII